MKKVIIIGAGIAGLSAGIYLRMKGYETEIYEMHNLSGGQCTSWDRKGYRFDGCIHWLTGSGEGKVFNSIWKEIGALDNVCIYNPQYICEMELSTGKTILLPSDLDKLKEVLVNIGPEDRKEVEKLFKCIQKIDTSDYENAKPRELQNIKDKIRFIIKNKGMAQAFIKYGRITVKEFVDRLVNEQLREVFQLLFGLQDFSMLAVIIMFWAIGTGNGGYPQGGAVEFSKRIERKYLDLGGKIYFKSKVVKINIEDAKVRGLTLSNGEIKTGDYVIAACDAYDTIVNMLDNKYKHRQINDMFREPKLFDPLIVISIGLKEKINFNSGSNIYKLDAPISEPSGSILTSLNLKNYNYEQSSAPEGKTACMVLIKTSYDYWESLSKSDREVYDDQKQVIANKVIEELNKKIKGFKELVELVDVATPHTYVRYTNVWRGSWEGWKVCPKNMRRQLERTIENVDGLYLCGQWVEVGGGLPTAAKSGREIAWLICNRDGKEFL